MKLQALEAAMPISQVPARGTITTDAPLPSAARRFQDLLEPPCDAPTEPASARLASTGRRALDEASGVPGAGGPLGPLGLLRRRQKDEALGLPPVPVRIVKPVEQTRDAGPEVTQQPGVERAARRTTGLDQAELAQATHTALAIELARRNQAQPLAAALLKTF